MQRIQWSAALEKTLSNFWSWSEGFWRRVVASRTEKVQFWEFLMEFWAVAIIAGELSMPWIEPVGRRF